MSSVFPNVSQGPSIFEFLRDRIGEDGRLDDSAVSLPDESARGDEIKWAPGAMDGVFGHHGSAGGAQKAANDVASRIMAVTEKRPTQRRLAKLYRSVSGDAALDHIDPLIDALAHAKANVAGVHDVGRWLAETAAHRNAAKVGIALLGVTGLRDSLAVVRTLGAHEEFTLYAAVAIRNGTDEPDREIWALARLVDGWGRIECVDRLRDTKDPEIKDWILREGFRNSIMYEYLAYAAATTGGLRAALAAGGDRLLLTAAGEILDALIAGGPAENIDDYVDAAETIELYLNHMVAHASSISDFNAVSAIRDFLRTDWDRSDVRNGWSADVRDRLLAQSEDILSGAHWRDLIAADLRSDDSVVSWNANRAAKVLGIDTFDLHFERVIVDPLGGPWFEAWQQADEARARRLVDLARRRLPLDTIASGPGSENGFGPEWRAHAALDWTLQDLRRFAGLGGELLMVGLRSPVIRNRNMALKALESWPRGTWPTTAEDLVSQVAQDDPNESTRKLARELLTRG